MKVSKFTFHSETSFIDEFDDDNRSLLKIRNTL